MKLSYERIYGEHIYKQCERYIDGIKDLYQKSNTIFEYDQTKRYTPKYFHYLYFPFLFSEEFPTLSGEQMKVICKCAHLGADIVTYYDHIIDCEFEVNDETIHETFENYFFTIHQTKQLCGLFDNNSEFWNYYDAYLKQYFRALKQERTHYKNLIPYAYEEYAQTIHGIWALQKWPVAAMACLSGRQEKIAVYEHALDLCAEANQLHDDLKDWKIDYKEQCYNWLISSIMNERQLPAGTDIQEIGNALFKYDYDSLVLEKINGLYEEVMLCAGENKLFNKMVRSLQYQTNELYRDFCNMKGKIYTFVQLNEDYKPQNSEYEAFNNLIESGLTALIEQQQKKYPELMHWELFADKKKCIGGNLFQRAFVLNHLIALKNTGFMVADELISSEIDYLCGKMTETGFSYFNDHPHVISDIDILAEMLKLSKTYPDENLNNSLIPLIESAIIKNRHESGAFVKWAFASSPYAVHFKLTEGMNDAGGESEIELTKYGTEQILDPAVNANFLHALQLYDAEIYAPIIDRCFQWLLEKWADDANRQSKIYPVDYYTDYLMSSVFMQNEARSIHAQKLYDSIVENQNENGSWGSNGGTPLDTAFALLTLITMDRADNSLIVVTTLERGLVYLGNTHNKQHRLWNGCEFINLFPGARNMTNIYKSCTLTAAVCLSSMAKTIRFLRNIHKKESTKRRVKC